MPIDHEQLFTKIKDLVNERLTSQNLSTPPDFLYRWIIAAVETEHAIIPKNVPSTGYNISRFQEIVSSWLEVDNVDSTQVQAEQILYQLANEGWTVIPPV